MAGASWYSIGPWQQSRLPHPWRCLPLQSAVADEVENQVKQAYSAWDAAFNKKDTNAIAAFYTDLLTSCRRPIRSSKAQTGLQNLFSGLFEGGVSGHKLEMIEANGNGNIIYAAAKWSAKGKDDKGKPKALSG